MMKMMPILPLGNAIIHLNLSICSPPPLCILIMWNRNQGRARGLGYSRGGRRRRWRRKFSWKAVRWWGWRRIFSAFEEVIRILIIPQLQHLSGMAFKFANGWRIWSRRSAMLALFQLCQRGWHCSKTTKVLPDIQKVSGIGAGTSIFPVWSSWHENTTHCYRWKNRKDFHQRIIHADGKLFLPSYGPLTAWVVQAQSEQTAQPKTAECSAAIVSFELVCTFRLPAEPRLPFSVIVSMPTLPGQAAYARTPLKDEAMWTSSNSRWDLV